MAVINENSICTYCKRLEVCEYDKFLRKDCPYFMQRDGYIVDARTLCLCCGHPTIPTGRCRTCPLCGESTGCA